MANRVQLVVAIALGIAMGAAGYGLLVTPRPAEPVDSVSAAPARPETAQPSVAASEARGASKPEPALPEIPVSLGYVEARSGRGYLVQVHNQSQKHLAVLVEIENKTMKQKRSGPLQLAPGQLVELGDTPEWIFVSGEEVTIKLDGYKTKTFQIP